MLRGKPDSFYLGSYHDCFCGFSNTEKLKENAASGGLLSHFLVYLLNNNRIDGALLTRLRIQNGQLLPVQFIARSKEEIYSAQSSIYIDFSAKEALNLAKDFKGRLAVVGLPCQLKLIKRLNRKQGDIMTGLFCGHTSKSGLIERVLSTKCRLSEMQSFRFRSGHWRGYSSITLKSGKIIKFPYLHFGIFQNLFFNVPARCLYCKDHTAEEADVSFGDLWLKEFKRRKNKYTCVISRSPQITDLFVNMKESGEITLEHLEAGKVLRGQRRSLIYHKFVTNALSRLTLGQSDCRSRWNDFISAAIILLNSYVSEKRFASVIFRIPRAIIFAYMAFFRVLLTF